MTKKTIKKKMAKVLVKSNICGPDLNLRDGDVVDMEVKEIEVDEGTEKKKTTNVDQMADGGYVEIIERRTDEIEDPEGN